jgi:hypothetical protein
MNLTATRSAIHHPLQTLKSVRVRSWRVYSAIIVLALIAFEAVNYSTTAYALRDLLGDLQFIGIRWATLMALAFCSLDFAGIARLVTQKSKLQASRESWFLFGAWLIAGTFNAALTWWGVTIAITNHPLRSAEVVSTHNLTTVVPLVVAILVWVIRILIIGSLTSSLEQSSSARKAVRRVDGLSQPDGFPAGSRPAAGFSRAQSSTPSARSVNPRAGVTSMVRSSNARAGQPIQRNEFMAAEEQSAYKV